LPSCSRGVWRIAIPLSSRRNAVGTDQGAGCAGHDERRRGRMVEVEVAREVAGDRDPFAYIGAGVGGRVDAFAAEEVVLDELEVGIVAEDLVVVEMRAARRG
jgi:hypothetical protein